MLSSNLTTKRALRMLKKISKDRRWADSKSLSSGPKKAITTIKLSQAPGLMLKSLAVRRNVTTAIEPDITPESVAPGVDLVLDHHAVVIEIDRIQETGDVGMTIAGLHQPDIADEVPKEVIGEETIRQDATTIDITDRPFADDLPKETLDVSLSYSEFNFFLDNDERRDRRRSRSGGRDERNPSVERA
jgi:hypothetical protein